MKLGISEKEEAKRLRLLELWLNKINAELDDEHQLIKSGKITLPKLGTFLLKDTDDGNYCIDFIT